MTSPSSPIWPLTQSLVRVCFQVHGHSWSLLTCGYPPSWIEDSLASSTGLIRVTSLPPFPITAATVGLGIFSSAGTHALLVWCGGRGNPLNEAPKGESPLLSLLRSPQSPRTSAACDQHSFASLLTEEGESAVLAGPQETPPLQRWQGQAGGKALAQAKLRSGKEGEKNRL